MNIPTATLCSRAWTLNSNGAAIYVLLAELKLTPEIRMTIIERLLPLTVGRLTALWWTVGELKLTLDQRLQYR